MQESYGFEIQQILPDIVLSTFGIAILLIDPFLSRNKRQRLGVVALLGVLVAALCTVNLITNDGTYFSGMVVVDNFSIFFRFIFLLITGLTVLSSLSYLKVQKLDLGEYHALLLFANVGMNLMAASNELIMIFLGLETLSISCYILLGTHRASAKSNESALKYFLLGSFSSAFLLYGVALVYGATRTSNLELIARAVLSGSADMNLIYFAAGLFFVGIGFKVATAPFHVWTPDVYEGAPSPISAFMSVGPKAAGFALFLRLFQVALPATYDKWFLVVWVSAVLTMTLGNVVAIVQSNIKRMLAYSSIAHAGYILVAIAAGTEQGTAAVLFYGLAYTLMNVGAFTVVALVGRENEQKVGIEDYAGLGSRQPALAACLSVFLLSLAGIPLTAGFAGKFFIFKAAVDSHLIWLAVIGVLNSAISVYYYLRVIVLMYMKASPDEASAVPVSASVGVVLGLSVWGILQLGIYPDLVVRLAQSSVFALR
ncbi:MAG: NADH-quinone oxidoreductase subunit N [Acidobacteriota bacterium]